MDNETALVVKESSALTTPPPLDVYISVTEIVTRLRMVQEMRKEVMQPDIHFGVIPGTEKPTLYQAGADLLRMMFNLEPHYTITRSEDVVFPHREEIVHTILRNAATGAVWGQGVGSCSTLESKYRWRNAKRKCPTCEAETVAKNGYAKSAAEYWYCKSCKARFAERDPALLNQVLGKIENPDIADVYNTVLKIAKKRSFVDAILNATGAREMFISAPNAKDEEEEGGEREPEFEFIPGESYAGVLTALATKPGQKNRRYGVLTLATEYGDLVCFFFSRPELLKHREEADWSKLLNERYKITFKIDKGGYRLVETFEPDNDKSQEGERV